MDANFLSSNPLLLIQACTMGDIEKAIEKITGEQVDLTASGRTDRGVHALRTSC